MAEAIKRKAADYRSETKPTWCPGCGDFGAVGDAKAFAQLNLIPNRSSSSGSAARGVSPSSWGHGFHGVWARAADGDGVKLANPELTVVAVGGDGDGFAIGGGHVPTRLGAM